MEYADFRESLKLLTLFHPLLRGERKDSRGRVRGFVHCSAKQRGRQVGRPASRRVQLGVGGGCGLRD